MRRVDLSLIFTAEVRAIQGLYPLGHSKLRNWGAWSRDRSGIFPSLSPPGLWEQCVVSKFGDFADARDEPDRVEPEEPAKAERAETEPYDEKSAEELDELLHREFPYKIRKCLLVAYVTVSVPEGQFPALSCCTHADFLARLAQVLGRVDG